MDKYDLKPGFRHNNDLESVRMRYEEKNVEDGFHVYIPPDDTTGKNMKLSRCFVTKSCKKKSEP